MIRLGIIGAGQNAAGHARYYHASPRARVVAVADPDRERAASLAGEVGAEAVADHREFLERVDAAIISSPNHLHREQAVACALAGVHVYCEKPMGLSRDDAEEMAAAARRADIKSAVGFSVRFSAAVQTFQRLVRESRMGEIISICSRRLDFFYPENHAPWRRDQRLSGGLLMEIALHELDWMMSLGGEVASVSARSWTRDAKEQNARANDHLWVMLDFAGGGGGLHEGSWLSATPQYLRSVQGTEAGVSTDEWGTKLYFNTPGGRRADLAADAELDLRGHFLDCIEHGATPVADLDWGLKVMTVAEAVLAAAKTRQTVFLSATNPAG